jgi:hypothetical protein
MKIISFDNKYLINGIMSMMYMSRLSIIYCFQLKTGCCNGHKLLALILANIEYPLSNFKASRLPLHFYQEQ